MTHNDRWRTFTIHETHDRANVGTHTVTLRSEIQIPEDASMTTFRTMFVEYTFNIVVTSTLCEVTDYSAT